MSGAGVRDMKPTKNQQNVKKKMFRWPKVSGKNSNTTRFQEERLPCPTLPQVSPTASSFDFHNLYEVDAVIFILQMRELRRQAELPKITD